MPVLMEPRAPAPAKPGERPPNQVAEQITGRTYLSHSQISMMRACPKKFELHYVDHSPPEFIASSLIFGGAIHSALESYFRACLEGRALGHGELLAAYHAAWDGERREKSDLPVRFNKNETETTVQALAGRMLAAFLASPLASPRGTILGIEEELRVVLHPDLPDILARVDLVTRTPGAMHIVDFKTSRSRWNEQKAVESGDQLLIYGLTLGRMSRSLGLPVQLHFAVLTKAKTPVVQVLPVPTDAERVTAMTESVAAIWEAIQVGNFYPAPHPMNCSTCAFKSRCPAVGGR